MTLRLFLLFPFLFLMGSCSSIKQPNIPDELLGLFEDDYGIQYAITHEVWHQLPDTRYHIKSWHITEGYLIAQNDENNSADAGLWTRIDLMPLQGMPPYNWAFCLSAYNAPDKKTAMNTDIADKKTPRTGCNGYPFSRMKERP